MNHFQIIPGPISAQLGTDYKQIDGQPVFGHDIDQYCPVSLLVCQHWWCEGMERFEPCIGDRRDVFVAGHGDMVEIAALVLRAAPATAGKTQPIEPARHRHGAGDGSPQGILAPDIRAAFNWHVKLLFAVMQACFVRLEICACQRRKLLL